MFLIKMFLIKDKKICLIFIDLNNLNTNKYCNSARKLSLNYFNIGWSRKMLLKTIDSFVVNSNFCEPVLELPMVDKSVAMVTIIKFFGKIFDNIFQIEKY